MSTWVQAVRSKHRTTAVWHTKQHGSWRIQRRPPECPFTHSSLMPRRYISALARIRLPRSALLSLYKVGRTEVRASFLGINGMEKCPPVTWDIRVLHLFAWAATESTRKTSQSLALEFHSWRGSYTTGTVSGLCRARNVNGRMGCLGVVPAVAL